jgi:hypothetical protein
MLSDAVRDAMFSTIVEALELVPCDAPCPSYSSGGAVLPPTHTLVLACPLEPLVPTVVIHVTMIEMKDGLVAGDGDDDQNAPQQTDWMRRPLVLVTARFADEGRASETVELRGLSSLTAMAATGSGGVSPSVLTELKAAVVSWRGGRMQSSHQSSPAAQQTTNITFGVPQAFASRGPPVSTTSADYGRSDLEPTGGSGGFARHGGYPIGSTPGRAVGGGMMLGPQHPIFGAGPPSFANGGDPAGGLARYDDITTGGRQALAPRFGGPPGQQIVFPGEPDPDHLRPWQNDELDPLRGLVSRGRGGRGRGSGGLFGRGGPYI